jgi:predicted esterase YcpF (UPF0227 family)
MKPLFVTSLVVGCCLASPQYPRTAHYSQNFNGFKSDNFVYADRFSSDLNSPDYIDPEPYVQKALNTKLNLDPRIIAQRDSKSPSAAAALEYMHQIASNDLCAHSTEAFLEMILNGASPEEANAEATRVFIQEHNRGQKADSGSACEASIHAWQNAEKTGVDPILASAIAFMKNHPNVKNGNPCAVSGVDYVKAVVNGKSHTEANRIAANSFASTLIKRAQKGEDMRDTACAAATKAFFHALPEKPSAPNAAAMMAFLDKTFSTQKFSHDPVCWKSTEAFFKSYDAGNDELTNNLAAADAFLDEFAKGSTVPVDSPCAAATRAYYANIENPPSPPNKAAMEAFMDKMIKDGKRQPDPVCAKSARGFFEAHKAGKSEFEANLAAAEAFFDEFAKGGSGIPADSPCAASTIAYYNAVAKAPSPANKAAMEAFMTKMISGGERQADPVCAASTRGYWNAWKAGATELEANLAAAQTFFEEFLKGKDSVPVDSPCAAATRAYYKAIPNPPSPANKAAMEAFMDKMIAQGKRQADPVCAASLRGYWDAYKNGADELTANLAAAEAFFKAFAEGSNIPVDSPCAASTRAYYAALPNPPSGANKAAMEAFMDKMIADGKRTPDPVCAASTRGYWDAYYKGASELGANRAAGEAFLEEYVKGSSIPADSPCAAATRAYWGAIPKPSSPANRAAMEAFMDKLITSNGGKRTQDPVCAASLRGYFAAWKDGKGELESNRQAGEAFLEEFAKGSSLPSDSPCAAATVAYSNNLSNPPSPANKAAMDAFMGKMINGNGTRTADPVCAASLKGYFEAWKAGLGELESNRMGAEYFMEEFAKGSKVPVDSPCAAATRAYYKALPKSPSPPNKAAMEAFMDKMISDGARQPDPVCAASMKSYWVAYKAGASETAANLAAAEGFFTAYNDGMHIPADSPCVAATKAYYQTLERKPSGPNADAMIAFIDHMISHSGNKREYDPACAEATKAFFAAHKAGESELKANMRAAQAFFKEFQKGINIPADSACAAATYVYSDNIKHSPSYPNAMGMITYMQEAVTQGNRKIDPVCAASMDAYFEAYLDGKSEAKSNQAAGVAFLDAVASNPDYSPDSACGKSAQGYMSNFEL